jgi:flagellar basal-body rod protein FlgB
MSFIGNIPTLAVLRTKMQWHQKRQRLLAENVANSDVPNFKPRDLVAPRFDARGESVGSIGTLALARTSPDHIEPSGSGDSFDRKRKAGFETRPSGNAVSLEGEMTKLAANQMYYQAVTQLYTKSLRLLNIAIGKG